ncbi:MAG: hypothetical protein ABR591_15575 [Candidatus Velthaea sp.]
MDNQPKSPDEARREGLDKLDRRPHHATTEKTTNSLHDESLDAAPSPTEEHRRGPLPFMKK